MSESDTPKYTDFVTFDEAIAGVDRPNDIPVQVIMPSDPELRDKAVALMGRLRQKFNDALTEEEEA